VGGVWSRIGVFSMAANIKGRDNFGFLVADGTIALNLALNRF
jgi:hypothetical protein